MKTFPPNSTVPFSDTENSFARRLKRYSQATGTLGGLASFLLKDRVLGLSPDSHHHALSLTENLGHLKGPLMKIAQILATIPDVLPPEYANAFLELQANAPPMGWPFVKRRLVAELGPQWQDHFSSFEKQAVAAASLGQVHQAISLEGRPLALKLQYPDMGAAVQADLAQFKLFLKSFELYSGAFKTDALHQEVATHLWEELDYLKEAQHLRHFKKILAPFPFIAIPDVITPLTTSRLLTMTWLEGQKILTFLDSPQDLRNEIAKALFTAWYVPLYHQGILHGDPHFGNYSWNGETATLNLFDFGCVRVFPPSFIQGSLDLYRALQSGHESKMAAAYEAWGFTHLDKEMIRILNLWAKFLYGPLLDDRSRPLEETYSGHRGRALVGEILAQLKQKGGLKPPPEFVLMDRAAVGLGSVCLRLKAHLNWHQLFEDIITGFSSFPSGPFLESLYLN